MQTLSHQNPRHITLPLFAAVLVTALAAAPCFAQSSVGGNTTPSPAVSATAELNTPTPSLYSSTSTHNTPQRLNSLSGSNPRAQLSIDVGSNYLPPSPFSRALQYASGAKPTDLLHLCLSVVSCAVAFFLLYQSIALQRMLTHGHENAPDPDAGAGVAWLLFWLTCGICSFYWVASAQDRTGYSEPLDFFRQDWWGAALETPRAFAPTLLIASIAPGAIALYKFAFALAWLHSRNVRARGQARFAVGGVMKQDTDSVLSRLDDNMATLKARFSALETALSGPSAGARIINEQSEKRRTADIRYVIILTGVFCAVTSALVWASTLIPILSVFTLASFAIVVLMLVAVLDLSKGDKLSERSVMEVIRRAFKFISRRSK